MGAFVFYLDKVIFYLAMEPKICYTLFINLGGEVLLMTKNYAYIGITEPPGSGK